MSAGCDWWRFATSGSSAHIQKWLRTATTVITGSWWRALSHQLLQCSSWRLIVLDGTQRKVGCYRRKERGRRLRMGDFTRTGSLRGGTRARLRPRGLKRLGKSSKWEKFCLSPTVAEIMTRYNSNGFKTECRNLFSMQTGDLARYKCLDFRSFEVFNRLCRHLFKVWICLRVKGTQNTNKGESRQYTRKELRENNESKHVVEHDVQYRP